MSAHWDFEPPTPEPGGVTYFSPPVHLEDHIDIAMVRNRPEWVWPVYNHKCLQLGCGNKLIEGENWTNLDWPEWDPERPGYALPYADDSIGHITCYHTLDHLTPDGVIAALKDWQRVLAPGAAATIITPHYSSQLANECIQHKSRFAIDTFRNIFSERQYSHEVDGQKFEWKYIIGANFLFGYTERNLVTVTQLIKEIP